MIANIFHVFTCLLLLTSSASKAETNPFQAAEIVQEEASQDLESKQNQIEKELSEREHLANEANKTAKASDSVLEKALAVYLSELQSYLSGVSELKLVRIKSLKETISTFGTKSEALKEIQARLRENPNEIKIEDLELATKSWRSIVDDTIYRLFETEKVNMAPTPSLPEGINLETDKHKELVTAIKEALEEIEKEQKTFIEVRNELLSLEKSSRSRLLLVSGQVRSELMIHLIDAGEYSEWALLKNDPIDYLREVQVVPYRLIATFTYKYYEVKELLETGPTGWVEIFKQLFLLVLVLALPYFVFKSFRNFSEFLERTRSQIFTKSQLDYRTRTKLAVWIGRLNPYVPWAFAFFTVLLTQYLLTGTVLEPLSVFLPYLNVYVGYRAFRIFLSSALTQILLSKTLDSVRSKTTQVEGTTRKLSRLFFAELAILYGTQDAVRQALVYHIIFDLVICLNLFVIAIEAKNWKKEILSLSRKWMKPSWVDRLEAQNGLVLNLSILPLVFVADIIHLVALRGIDWLGRFEFGKKIFSELYKKRLEEAIEGNGNDHQDPPDDYRQLFTVHAVDKSTRVHLSRSPTDRCINMIENWRSNRSSDDLMVLYGNFGIGKTTILNNIANHFHEKLQICRVELDRRLTHPSELYGALSKAFNTNIESSKDLEKIDKEIPKTLLVIDDIQKLYLNSVDGLGAYRKLITLTSLQLENVFWCLSCNERSLAHLNGLFGYHHFIGEYIELMSWTDVEIQDLIMKRHNIYGSKLHFDQIISAVHRGDVLESVSGLEVQFFRMLWGQSRGNPRTAQELWLTATQVSRSNDIRVSVPEFTNSKDLSDFSDETLMVFANIVKHESLYYADFRKVMSISESKLKQALKMGKDGLILQKNEDGTWRIHPKAQYVVHAQLLSRNLIYG